MHAEAGRGLAPERGGYESQPHPDGDHIGQVWTDGDIMRELSGSVCAFCGDELWKLETSGQFCRTIGPTLDDYEEVPDGMDVFQCGTCFLHFFGSAT